MIGGKVEERQQCFAILDQAFDGLVVFPNIPRDQLVEQRRFTVRLGHKTHEFDSAAQWEKSGRADILIGDVPIIVEIEEAALLALSL